MHLSNGEDAGPDRRRLGRYSPTPAPQLLPVGHNLAFLGLVNIPAAQFYRILEFVGVTLFLAFSFALLVALLENASAMARFLPRRM
ncbi:MAG TPA: hypothetical protein VF115_04000 [Acidimicrobiia bacterium]